MWGIGPPNVPLVSLKLPDGPLKLPGGPGLLFPTELKSPRPLAYGWLVPETAQPRILNGSAAPSPTTPAAAESGGLYHAAAAACPQLPAAWMPVVPAVPPEPVRQLFMRRKLSRHESAFAFIAAFAFAVSLANLVSGALARLFTSPPKVEGILPADPSAAAAGAAARAAAVAAGAADAAAGAASAASGLRDAAAAATADLDWVLVALFAGAAALIALVCFRFVWAMLLAPRRRRAAASAAVSPARRGRGLGASPLAVDLPVVAAGRRGVESGDSSSEAGDEDDEDDERTTLL
jgi:hypothetical protein